MLLLISFVAFVVLWILVCMGGYSLTFASVLAVVCLITLVFFKWM